MEIILNNRLEKFEYKSITISELLKEKNFSFSRIIIKLNGQLIKKPEYQTTYVINNDKLDIIHMISGG